MGAKAVGSVAPSAAAFYASHRGGGLLTELLNQRIGSWLALAAARLRLAPSVVTAVGALVGLGGTALVLVFGEAAGLVALSAWHVAYSLDCADGQLARVTGQASPAGARLDVLCDFLVQAGVVTAVATVAAVHSPQMPAWIAPAFASAWLVNLFTSVLASGSGAASLMASAAWPVRALKLIRDYSVIITLCGSVIFLFPSWTVMLMLAFIVINGSFLALSIGQALGRSLSR